MSRSSLRASATALAAVAVMVLACTPALAQGRPPGKGGGGGHTEVTSNNLSYPAVMTQADAALQGVEGEWSLDTAVLGKGFSYGCGTPVEEFPNTSCVVNDDPTQAMDYLTCSATLCAGQEISRIYWQKTAGVTWRADAIEAVPVTPRSWEVSHVDWGDNLESRTWTTNSIIRVETTPFTTLPGDLVDPVVQRGYQMWHVSGKGTDELWGLRTTAPEANVTESLPIPFAYASPYAIVHTGAARLSMTKIGKAASVCLEDGVDPNFAMTWQSDPVQTDTYLTWVSTQHELCEVRDTPYTAELNIGGKFVYGYNWNMRREPGLCTGFQKAGWWRLTFYTAPNDAGYRPVLFSNTSIVLTPPVLPVAAPLVMTLSAAEAAESEGGAYRPKVDHANHLTYIDVCVKAR